ncbi:MAG: T9SS type A sorting domain-containing protein [candidate division Zixibacteria bacterium]|nr:T9SS type A sorting domain-containing protein [candidate division Zixibacteria bacterium]
MYRTLLLSAILAICLIATVSAEQTKTIVQSAVNGPIADYPVVLDDMEDMIAYDSAPQVYYPNALSPGTMFAVRFTPVQACSLTYVQVVSYNGSGNAIIHVMSDDGGSPDVDLIDPFTVSLAGNISYQTITLPEIVVINDVDFHVAVEYSQAPPPFVTADGDGTTTQRSKLWEPGDTDWSALSADLNIRAFVIYYGVDGVPPTINHTQQVLGFASDDTHDFTAEITDGSGVESAELHYSLDGSTWETVDMVNTSGDAWDGSIPVQPAGNSVGYYLSATDTYANTAYEPEGAGADPFVMEIVAGTELAYDDGSVDGWWIVAPDYDDNAFAVRMTPDEYPATVLMVRAFVSDDTPFDYTINGVMGGVPGDILPGGEALQGIRAPHGWAISEYVDGPTIASGSFFVLFNWRPSTPSDPAVGEDTDNVTFRSYWYSATSGWNMIADGEYMIRAIVSTPTGIKEINGDGARPASFELVGNYPNPFNPSTDIKFLAPEAGNVKIEIYNVAGQLVKTVLDEYVSAGVKAVTWDGTNSNGVKVNSGVYLYKMTAGNHVETEKMVLLK